MDLEHRVQVGLPFILTLSRFRFGRVKILRVIVYRKTVARKLSKL